MANSLVVQTVKCLPTVWETWVQFLGWEDPLEKEEQKAIYVKLYHFYTCLCTFQGEGNGTPLQYSCLENPMDGGAW